MPHRRFVHVVGARALGAHRVWIRFDDGAEGEVDLAAHLDGEVFAPLRDAQYFAQLRVGAGRTLEWPNGADFAPEFLHDLVERSARRAAV
jgi:uncharacterized protein DUF2442